MKKIIYLISTLLLGVICFSCHNNVDDTAISYDKVCNDTVRVNEHEFITMYVSPERIPVNANAVSIKIENNTTIDISYGTYFTMEFFNGKEWSPIVLDIAFEDILYTQYTMEIKEIKVIHNLHLYTTGKYRIKKEITIAKGETHNLSAEFILE